MPRPPSPPEQSKDMAVSYSSGHSPGHTPKLPSFRELLPDYLHDEIDSASYHLQTGSHQQQHPHHQHSSRLPPVSRQEPPSRRGSGTRHHPGSVGRGQDYDSSLMRQNAYLEGQSRYHSHHLPQERQYYDDRAPLTPSSRSSSRHLDPSDPRNFLPPLRNYEALPGQIPSPVGRHDDRGYERAYDAERASYASSRSSTLSSMTHGTAGPYPSAYNSPIHGSYQGYYGGDLESTAHSAYMDTKPTKYDPLGDTADSKSKKRRGNLPKPTTDILRAWFYEHLDHPYPSEQDKQMFMTRTGLTISQISNWFINARRRHLPALRNQGRIPDPDRMRPSSSMSEDDPDYDTSPSRR
ncbi:uncharacterized protein CIMG_02405 [Coccidioides immitis RS]|nr:uncharacterized protein CIMG_02405 [Coccidioides immitis RS]EAS37051.3 hypothetical protein CIMG_02405 [Coccidioides immitis RS]KMP09982.1 AhpA [Coccidioides immitis RMSCC 2394]TPX24926.1 hypothetical protein DIZ76_010374 [Coccidioides immitis]